MIRMPRAIVSRGEPGRGGADAHPSNGVISRGAATLLLSSCARSTASTVPPRGGVMRCRHGVAILVLLATPAGAQPPQRDAKREQRIEQQLAAVAPQAVP